MFDKKIMKQLENMINQMKPSQKEKLNNMLSNEESLKKALDGVNTQKAQELAKTLNLNLGAKDVNQLVEDIKKNPDIIKNLDKK